MVNFQYDPALEVLIGKRQMHSLCVGVCVSMYKSEIRKLSGDLSYRKLVLALNHALLPLRVGWIAHKATSFLSRILNTDLQRVI